MIPTLAIGAAIINVGLTLLFPDMPWLLVIIPALICLVTLYKRGWRYELIFVILPGVALPFMTGIVSVLATLVAIAAATLITAWLGLAVIFGVPTH